MSRIVTAEKGAWGKSDTLKHCKFYYIQVNSVDITYLHCKLYYSSQFNRYWTFAVFNGNDVGANKDNSPYN